MKRKRGAGPLFMRSFILALSCLILCFSEPGMLSAQPNGLHFNASEILQGEKRVSIPFRYVNNFLVLEVKLFGALPTHLIFDTGAEHIILFKRQYTDVLQVRYDKRIPILGSDLSRNIYALIARNSLVEIPGLAPKPFDILVLEEDYFNLEELIGTKIDGLIGGGFFRNLIIQIDYRNNRMTLHDPQHIVIPEDFTKMPVRMKAGKPYVDAQAKLQDGSTVNLDLLVDTGAGVALLLHNNSHPSLKLPDHIIRGKLGMGLGGFLEGYIGRINKLSIGDVDFTGVLTSFQDIKPEWLIDQERFRHGILGNQLLNRFNVFFDYIQSNMYLRPYRAKQRPFTMDRSGLVVFAYGVDFNQFIVRDVLPDSPALEADIRTDDIILKIQGFPTHFFTLDGINAVFQKKPGKRIRLTILRDGKKLKKEFCLRELV